MDPAYFSAFAALAGSAIGGLTSLASSWLTPARAIQSAASRTGSEQAGGVIQRLHWRGIEMVRVRIRTR